MLEEECKGASVFVHAPVHPSAPGRTAANGRSTLSNEGWGATLNGISSRSTNPNRSDTLHMKGVNRWYHIPSNHPTGWVFGLSNGLLQGNHDSVQAAYGGCGLRLKSRKGAADTNNRGGGDGVVIERGHIPRPMSMSMCLFLSRYHWRAETWPGRFNKRG